MKTIFIAIPSLKDPELFKTIDLIFKNATEPDNIYVGLFYQFISLEEERNVIEKMSKYKNVRLKTGFVKDFLGISKGRNIAISLYNQEDYFLQIDSHTNFEKGWDKNVIDIFNQAREYLGSEMVILNAYLNEYSYKKTIFGIKTFYPRGSSIPSYTYMNNSKMILDYLPRWRNNYDKQKGDFLPSRKFSANFVFTYGKYINDFLLEDEVVFWSEEYTKSLDLLGKGYALVHPNKPLKITHYYGNNFTPLSGGQRFVLEDYYTNKKELEEITEKEKEFVIRYIDSHPYKAKYEAYAGIKFGKPLCKTIFYVPPVFFLRDIV